MAKTRSRYTCQSCGTSSHRWFGRCPGCGEWNTCVEEKAERTDARRQGIAAPSSEPVPITQVEGAEADRLRSDVSEFDLVLGGGIVPGSIVLLGGDPGIGKSTLLLQISGQLGVKGHNVLYVSAEESLAQTRMRAQRVGALSENLFVVSETNLDAIAGQIEKIRPVAVVVDSIQTMYRDDLDSAPGSVAQVRECAARLMYIAKATGVSVFLIGHMTKAGTVAGPRVVEHLVDSVLYLEGERHHHFRILRAAKNRFGSTNEIGLFEMRDVGMVEVKNPSEILLSNRSSGGSGSTVVCSVEGTRPLLVEIQALVTTSSFGYPQRVATGIDAKRLSILIAVLDKRAGIQLGSHDVFLNVAGGIRLDEPAVDLGSALAVASSFIDRGIDPKTVAIGEVGLGGEIRPVGQVARRLAEVEKLGFERCLISKGNLKGLKPVEGVEVIGVDGIEAARDAALAWP